MPLLGRSQCGGGACFRLLATALLALCPCLCHARKYAHCGSGDCLMEAAYTADVRALRELLALGLEDVNARRGPRRTPLHRVGYAPANSSSAPPRNASAAAEAAALLLAAGAEAEVRDSFGWTPLMFAASTGHSEVASVLIERGGARCDGIEKRHHRTALMFASLNGHAATARLLIARCGGPGNDRRTSASASASASASGGGQRDMVNVADGHGWTALHFAVANLRKAPPPSSSGAHHAASARASAAGSGDHPSSPWWSIAELLIRAGADVDAVEAGGGRSALHYAAHAGSVAAVRALLDAGASPSLRDAESRGAAAWAARCPDKAARSAIEVMLGAATVDEALRRHEAWLRESDGSGNGGRREL